jgi:hypothetical protein
MSAPMKINFTESGSPGRYENGKTDYKKRPKDETRSVGIAETLKMDIKLTASTKFR